MLRPATLHPLIQQVLDRHLPEPHPYERCLECGSPTPGTDRCPPCEYERRIDWAEIEADIVAAESRTA